MARTERALSHLDGSPIRVAIVEDEPMLGELLAMAMQAEGMDGAEQVIVGQSLADVDRTTSNLIWIFSLTGLLGLALAALVCGGGISCDSVSGRSIASRRRRRAWLQVRWLRALS